MVGCIALYALGYGYLFTAVKTIYFNGHTTAFLEDYKEFDNHIIPASSHPEAWPIHTNYNTVKATDQLNTLNTDNKSVAYLIIKNDSLWYEEYFDGYDKDSKSNSFSMAKTMVSALLGNAIMSGDIKSLEEPVVKYFPDLPGKYAKDLTVGDLSSMASGMEWDESYYSPFSVTTQAYFDKDLRSVMLDIPIISEPGKEYIYLSGNTQLLGMVIAKATGKSLAENFEEKFWQPMGAENEALWQVDSEEHGMEKAYCCIASNARDFARMGKLYKDGGVWNGKRILPKAFVLKSTHARFKESPEYGYGLWLMHHRNKDFFMLRGHLGQYVIVQPEDNVIIVRLGHTRPEERLYPGDPFTADTYGYIDEAYKMMEHATAN
ncbi:hypothetical protein NBRC110019_21910 [Neptunitalea chrysea]|uniref:Beta-lactamase-related domain-containing protein n=1 Tax=Neptunitalea chrysea TaxID=1647581 RepID=A0A9W6EVN5_9FLAO|nr:hypothetical protein NBRC110019_21910 [Neptunitalea chrysea]